MMRLRLLGLSVIALFLVGLLGWPVYVKPRIDSLRRADAIFVLGGTGTARYTVGLEDALSGLAPRVVFSNPLGSANIWLSDLCNHRRYDFNVSCIEPDPPTTRGEARELRRLADAEGWRSVIVVTYTPHVSRARYIIERCFHGELMFDNSDEYMSPLDWALSYLYQSAGYVRATLQSGC
ncbi:hypothetical protein D806_058520 [Mycolicibacterium smegmatis MKD8]|uniref:DUF218 domain-containing protein n=2 Tax=Mycolicibacterium smegmatis TaxID=1772 RepID=A0A2U9PYC2_MYCSE|nr:hypothetical protein D806_058520 [Mycolicibacterium smegmatis MKD8]